MATQATGQQVEVKLITPTYANYLLTLNSKNRKVNDRRVNRYASEMMQGLWKFNGDAIRISKSGVILDGQHRLMACVKSGVSFNSVVINGLDDSVFDTIDIGKIRSTGDVFYIKGVKSASQKSSIIRSYLSMKNDSFGTPASEGSTSITNTKAINEYNSRPEYWDALTNETMRLYNAFNMVASASFIGSFCALFNDIHEDNIVIDFCENMYVNNTSGLNVIDVMRNHLIRNRVSTRKMKRLTLNAYYIKTFNAFVTNKDMKIISFNEEREEFPQIINPRIKY